MSTLDALEAASRAFAEEAARVDPEAAVRSAIWPTAGRMIDHLGAVQAWATEVVRTGAEADRKAFRRPVDRERVEWFTDTSEILIAALTAADPDRECWTLFDAAPVTSFWGRRMMIEAAKHLWDLRTAVDATPRMPAELDLAQQADVIDEFAEVFVPAARLRGIEQLPRDLVFVAEDVDRGWRFSRDWVVTGFAGREDDVDSETLRADVGDLALLVWERADPWTLTDRFRRVDGDLALRAFARTPVHL